jgi:hypothetical protein
MQPRSEFRAALDMDNVADDPAGFLGHLEGGEAAFGA